MRCPECKGTGRQSERQYRCEDCDGTGKVLCSECGQVLEMCICDEKEDEIDE
jgi:RecJ-like exonuclease